MDLVEEFVQAPKPVPNFFSPPFQQWEGSDALLWSVQRLTRFEDEDAAQHAYNLQQWRLKILQAKVLITKFVGRS